MSTAEQRIGTRAEQKRRWDREHVLRSMHRPGRQSALTAQEIAKARELRASGMSTWKIADVMCRTQSSIWRHTRDV